jgi:hypothetical protein
MPDIETPQEMPEDDTPAAPGLRLTDFLLCATSDTEATFEEYQENRPVGNRFEDPSIPSEVDLGIGVLLKRLESDTADRLMDACSLRGENYKPTRQFGQYYTYVREIAIPDGEFPDMNWDPDNVIAELMQLSRLIVDNASSYQYAARMVEQNSGKDVIAPSDASFGKTIYRVRKTRDWLTVDEAVELRDLSVKFRADRNAIPARVTRGMWKTEYASSQAFAEGMIGELVSALESLLKTGRGQLTKQFRERVVPLAAELGIEGVTEEYADRMYEARSDWHHGAPVALFAPGDKPDEGEVAAVADVALLQDVARAAVRRSIEDDEFRARFESDKSVDDAWPLSD